MIMIYTSRWQGSISSDKDYHRQLYDNKKIIIKMIIKQLYDKGGNEYDLKDMHRGGVCARICMLFVNHRRLKLHMSM
jgi:hypothetical protein